MSKSWRLLLFLTAISGLVSNVAGLRATSLIFGRGPNGTLTPTTTTTTTTTDSSNSASTINQQPTGSPVIFTGITNGTDSVIGDEQINETDEVTKAPLTGIPQIDYVWDPNLPRELNGYNLSTYPFLSLVPDPEEIDFKCDGLHDGFYASLKYSCQLYHHCIYGIRHDFLCANFTAFDQKTFICQFVSEVNCKASPKYFFRNDALYVAATTTSTTTTTIAPPVTQPQPQYFDRPQQRQRRPNQRPRRPAQQADYYYDDDEYEQDDYVEEQRYPLRRRKQPLRGRTRRPEYEDDAYGGQSQGRRFNDDAVDRRPNRNRNPSAYDYDEEEEVPRPRNRNKNRFKEDRRRNQPVEDRDRFEDAPPPLPAKRPVSGNKDGTPARRKPAGRPKPQRFEEEEDEPVGDSDYDERPAAAPANRFVEDDASKVSPSGGGSALFSRPRAPPRINRPVPLNDKRKYEYAAAKTAKATTTTARPAPVDDGYETEYEDDYEEPAPAAPVVNNNDRSSTLYTRENRRPAANAKKPAAAVKQTIPAPIYEDDEEEEDDVRTPARTQYKQSASTTSRKIQRQPAINPLPAVIESRSKAKRPAVSAYSDEQYDEPQSRPKIQRRPAPTVNAYSDEDDTVSDDEVRVPLKRNSNPRPRIQQQRPLAAVEGRAYSRKSPLVPEILAEDDEDDQPEVPQNIPIVQPPRKSNRPGLLRPKPIATVAPSAQPEESRAVTNNGQSNFRKQFRSRDQSGRPSSTTTTTTTSTTSTTTTAIPVADEGDYASDEYEDDEYEPVAPPTTSTEPPRSALNKNPHRFAAIAPRQGSKLPAAPIVAQSSEEYFEPSTDVEVEVVPQVAATPPQSRAQSVRVVKRPFLPSRGGNPYLPRGLKPLGPVERDLPAYSDEDISGGQLELGATITGARLLEFHPPLVSRSESSAAGTATTSTTTTTTPAPVHQSLDPNRKLEEIFNSELDVTLNDALNPTLKPLSRSSPIGFSYKYVPSYYEPAANRRDSQVPSADLAQQSQIHTTFYGLTTGGGGRSAPAAAASVSDTEFYGDYEY